MPQAPLLPPDELAKAQTPPGIELGPRTGLLNPKPPEKKPAEPEKKGLPSQALIPLSTPSPDLWVRLLVTARVFPVICQILFLNSNAMRLDQKQFSDPVFSFIVLAQICEQAHHNRGKGFRVVPHLQCNNAPEVCRRIINDVGEIAVQRDQYGFEFLALSPQQVQALAAAASAHGVTLDVYVEVNVGANRCGVAPGDEAVQLARQIVATAPLRFMGLQCYHGPAQHMRSPQDRAAAIGSAIEAARMTRSAIEACGIGVERVTGAGTGSFVHERDSGVFDEIQAGTYAFMDRDYGDNQRGPGDIAFEHALFVRTTVMSRPTAARAIVDAGLKASGVDSGMPSVWQSQGLRYVKAADEHGVLAIADTAALSLGDQLMLVPGHCDPTFNLYDEVVCVRGERVEAVWPISARGALL